jgi:hypothetical protein
MAYTAGSFSPSILSAIIVAQGDIFKKSPNLYVPKTEVLREIVKMQTADVTPISASVYNRVNVTYQNSQAIQAAACAPTCTPDGVLTGTDATVMSLTNCTQVTFKKEALVGNDPNSAYAGSGITYAQSLATDFMQARKVIQEDVSAKMLAKLATFAGVNVDGSGQYGSVVGTGGTATTTTIPAANWGAGLFPFFQMEAEINRFSNPYLLDGALTGLYLNRLNAIPNALNDTQRDQLAKYQMMETAYDYFTFGKAGIVNTDFVVDGTAVAFAARNIYSSVMDHPEANTTVFSIPGAPTEAMDGTLTGASLFDIDVEVQRSCQVVSGVKKWYDVYTFKVPFFDLLIDPYRLGGGTNTGVLKFVKGS